ncbi:UDP-galactopyranose mutase [Kluyvera cryocrescens]|uniref:UDP-galactopyranose mutase n=1 Tax=Kluyvera cryocrescens TaxID=580 RepID=UPI002DBC86FC|nr:UDP-galactopyranose mutase [Kluyvera cryocrescens]MEB7713074.1 UDP-galactopyranose mutase [Kluyvera cryocrescens]
MYDYLIVGSGMFGAVCAHELNKSGMKVRVIDRREHLAGNVYTELKEGINVHKYGAHIFHTNDKLVWDYVNKFVEFNRFTNSPLACYNNKLYNLPFNMNTFYQLWGVKSPSEAKEIIKQQCAEVADVIPSNLEEKAISLVGHDIYEKLIKGYTEKQWGRKATELPSFIITRLPVRFTYDNNYFSDRYQGIPIGGYTNLIERMLDGIEVTLNIDYLSDKEKLDKIARKVIYTGPIDEYFNYIHGKLEYRSLRFEEQHIDIDNFQGNAVVNYTDAKVPFTRIIEHKHFESSDTPTTIITKEYPVEWVEGKERYYPVNDKNNMDLYRRYRSLSLAENNIHFGGRLAEYKYYDMHQVISSALNLVRQILNEEHE